MRNIRKKLIELIDKNMQDKSIAKKMNALMKSHDCTFEQFKEAFISYNLGSESSDRINANYKEIALRIVLHFHNLIKDSYHSARHQTVLDFFEEVNPVKVMDIGYGVIPPYISTYLQHNKEVKIILADRDDAAERVSRSIVKAEFPNVSKRVEYIKYDMDKEKYPGDADMYVYLDSVEHTKNPTRYIKKIVKKAKKGSYFIFSIPICSMKGMENFHYIEWLDEASAKKWIENAGLAILNENKVFPNKEVDYFAELIEGNFRNYIVLSKKV